MHGAERPAANDAGMAGRDAERASAADVMAKAESYYGKKLRVRGTIQRVDTDDTKDSIQVVLDGNLRCRVRKSDVEKRYATYTYHSDYVSRTPWNLSLVPKGNGRAARMSRTEKYRYSNKTARYHVDMFNPGEEIEIVGTVNRKSLNWVTLDSTTVTSYEWPQSPVDD